MVKQIHFFVTLISFLVLATGCSRDDNSTRHRLIYNNDGTDILGNYMFNRPLTVMDVKDYVDMVANTQVTTFMICSGSDFMYYRSAYGRILGDDKKGALDCGKDTATCRALTNYYRNHLNLEKAGTDIIETTLKRAKEKGMEAFISYRMNDLHFSDTSMHCPVAYTDFWFAHPEYWINENTGWHSAGALDFAFKQVREHKLNIIKEQLNKYEELLDGYDLDFMRFIVYFRSGDGEKNAPLMTELLKQIKAEVDRISAKRGKKILLSARVPVSLDFCLQKGLDVREWVRLGLIDFVSIGVHYIGNPVIPVAEFKHDLEAPSVPVYASIEDGGYSPRETYSNGMYRGMASHILSQGGDGIYLFNYFFDRYKTQGINTADSALFCRVIVPDLLREIGSLRTLRGRNKIYCLDDGGSAAYGYEPETALPLTVAPRESAQVSIAVGDDLSDVRPEESILFIRTDKPAKCSISINNENITIQKPEYVHLFDRDRNLANGEMVYAYTLPLSCLKQGNNDISFQITGSDTIKIRRVEIALKYGDVKSRGYF